MRLYKTQYEWSIDREHIFIKCDIQPRQRQAVRLVDRLVFMTHQRSSLSAVSVAVCSCSWQVL